MTADLERSWDTVSYRGSWVFAEIMRQISTDYAGAPDVRDMDLDELIWWYDGLRGQLREHFKLAAKK